MKNAVLAAGLLIGATALFVRCSPEANNASTIRVTSDSPVAWKLAAIDAGTLEVPRTLITEWEWQISRLHKKANGSTSKEEMSDFVMKAQSILEEHDIQRDLRSVARAIDSTIPSGGLNSLRTEFTDTSFRWIASLTVTREINGMPLIIRDRSAKRPLEGFKQAVRRE